MKKNSQKLTAALFLFALTFILPSCGRSNKDEAFYDCMMLINSSGKHGKPDAHVTSLQRNYSKNSYGETIYTINYGRVGYPNIFGGINIYSVECKYKFKNGGIERLDFRIY